MTGANRISSIRWTRERAALLAVGCLMVGIAAGWGIRGSQRSGAAPALAASPPTLSDPSATQTRTQPDREQMKQMADTQAAPLLDKLKADPANPDVLVSLGNLYYDAQQYPSAVDYYMRSL